MALDGSRIEVRTSLDVSRPFSTFANLRIGSHLQEFGAGDRDFALANAWDVGVRAFPETYWFQGGTLRLGTAAQFERTIKARSELLFAVWEGERHSLYTFAYNATSSSDLLAVLGRVRLTETPEGLAMAPTKPAETPMSDVCLAKELPTLGLLHDLLAREAGWPPRGLRRYRSAGGASPARSRADSADTQAQPSTTPTPRPRLTASLSGQATSATQEARNATPVATL
jgi:hypothetical protein